VAGLDVDVVRVGCTVAAQVATVLRPDAYIETEIGSTLDITRAALASLGFRPLFAGDSYDMQLALTSEGEPFDLTGAKIWFTVKAAYTDADSAAALQLVSTDTTPGVEVVGVGTGQVLLHLWADDTDSMAGSWKYDIKVKRGSLHIRAAVGIIELQPVVTRSLR
jgi:hypothetical protein